MGTDGGRPEGPVGADDPCQLLVRDRLAGRDLAPAGIAGGNADRAPHAGHVTRRDRGHEANDHDEDDDGCPDPESAAGPPTSGDAGQDASEAEHGEGGPAPAHRFS